MIPRDATAAAIYAADLRAAEALANRAYELVEALRVTGGKHGALQLRCRADLIRAMMAVVQDDSLPDALSNAEAEYDEVSRLGRRAA